MLLAQRTPSVNWEPVPLDPSGRHVVWVWFRPAAVPYGLMFAVPAALFAESQIAAKLFVRQLVAATGLVEERILCWTLNGMTFDAAGGNSPLLDQPLPPPLPDTNLDLSVWIEPYPQLQTAEVPSLISGFPVQAMAPGGFAGAGCSDADFRLLEAIDSSWTGILQLEARIGIIRKELGGSISRLNSLNRDLSSDERRTCDNKDKQDWIDARRWLRDSLSQLSRSVKEIDVGTTSGAGQRHKFEEIHRKYVATRTPFAGLAQAVNEFESHRKTVQNVLASAQANIARAGRDAEQRANSVLVRIGAKMRSDRRKD